ncbi:MAG TPA: hypothetical protein VFV43_13520 [Limnobacter sp.]|nr:hypothetical protein [Limnobacter sp.]
MKEHLLVDSLLVELQHHVVNVQHELYGSVFGFEGTFCWSKYERWAFDLSPLHSPIYQRGRSFSKARLKPNNMVYGLEEKLSSGSHYSLYFRTVRGILYQGTYLRYKKSIGLGQLLRLIDHPSM